MTEGRIEILRASFGPQAQKVVEARERALFWGRVFQAAAWVGAGVMVGSGFGMRAALLKENAALFGRAFHVMGVGFVVLGAGYGWQRYLRNQVGELAKDLERDLAQFKKDGSGLELGEWAWALFEEHGAELPVLLKYAKEPDVGEHLEAWAAARGGARLLKRRCKVLGSVALAGTALAGVVLALSVGLRRGLPVMLPLGVGAVGTGLVVTMAFRQLADGARADAKRYGELIDRGVKRVMERGAGRVQVRGLLPVIGEELGRLDLVGSDQALADYLSYCPNLRRLSVEGMSRLPDMRERRVRKLKVRGVAFEWEKLPRGLRELDAGRLEVGGDVKGLVELKKLKVDQVGLRSWLAIRDLPSLERLTVETFLGVGDERLELPKHLKRLKVPNLPAAREGHPLRGHEGLKRVTFAKPDRASFEAVPKMRVLRELSLKESTGLDATSLDWILSARELDEVRLKAPLPRSISGDDLVRLCAKEHYVVLLDGENSKYLSEEEMRSNEPYDAKSVCFKRTGA